MAKAVVMGTMKIIDPRAWTYAGDAPYAWRVLKSMQIDPDVFRCDADLAKVLPLCVDGFDGVAPISRGAIRDVAVVSFSLSSGPMVRAALYRDAWPRLQVGPTIYWMLLRASGIVKLSEQLREFALSLLLSELAEHMQEDPFADPGAETQDVSIMQLVRMIREVQSGRVVAPATKSRLWHLSFVGLSIERRRFKWEMASALMREMVVPSQPSTQEALGLALLDVGEG